MGWGRGTRARGGGSKGCDSGGVGGRGTGPRDGANFATCVVQKEEKWRFLKDALQGGGRHKGSGRGFQGLRFWGVGGRGTAPELPGGQRGRPREARKSGELAWWKGVLMPLGPRRDGVPRGPCGGPWRPRPLRPLQRPGCWEPPKICLRPLQAPGGPWRPRPLRPWRCRGGPVAGGLTARPLKAPGGRSGARGVSKGFGAGG